MTTRWLTTEGASDHTAISVSTLNKLRVFGGGPRFSKVGRSVRYCVQDLDDWLRSQMVGSTSEAVAA